MTMYSGDEFYGDDITSGPAPEDEFDFDAERQALQDEYDEEHR